MFCSEKCYAATRIECNLVKCGSAPFPVLICLRTLNLFENVTEMKNFFDSVEGKKFNVFDFDLSKSDNPSYELNLLLATMSLMNEANLSECIETLTKCTNFIHNHPKLEKMWNHHRNFFNKFLVKLCQISTFKEMHKEWSSSNYIIMMNLDTLKVELKNQGMFASIVGWQLDPYVAMLNGSCSPNVRLVTVDNKIVWTVTRPLNANEQLFRSYGEEFLSGPSALERRQELMRKFGYECNCDACVHDYPVARDLKEIDLSFVYDDISKIDEETAKEMFKSNCDYINENFHNFPSKELCYLMSVNVLCLGVLSKPASFFT